MSDAGVKYDPKVELHRRDVASVARELLALDVGLVIVSGGEPLSQQTRLVPLVERLRAAEIDIEIETNGTRVPDERLADAGVRFNVSPKLAHSGDPVGRRIVPAALRRFAVTPDTMFKFVCRSTDDLDEVAVLAAEFALPSVWIMPEGQSRADIDHHMESLVTSVIDRGWNVTTRLHTMIWGHKRGV